MSEFRAQQLAAALAMIVLAVALGVGGRVYSQTGSLAYALAAGLLIVGVVAAADGLRG